MSRQYSKYNTPDTKILLNILANKNVSPVKYRQAMTSLGESFGNIFINEIPDRRASIYLASTVEDADYLAQGMLKRLEESHYQSIGFACFWNKRFSPFGISDLKIAPVLKRYQEPIDSAINYLVIVKSIISGGCVVSTNLTNLIKEITPKQIFIIAPVIYKDAEEKLKAEFDKNIYRKFQFRYFARDDERMESGEVIPGIGGMVYERLGFQGQEEKNQYVPEIVKRRRQRLLARLSR